MRIRSFTTWAEALETQRAASQFVVLNTLRDALNINDDDVLLNLKTNDMEDDVIQRLIAVLPPLDADALNRIKNGITVSELIRITQRRPV